MTTRPVGRNPLHSDAARVATWPAVRRARWAEKLGQDKAAGLEHDWCFWARPNQLPPAGDWTIWLVLAGRGFGKTRLGAEWVRAMVTGATPLSAGRYRRIALVAETAADGRNVMVEGASGLLAVHKGGDRPTYEPSKRLLTWPNGAIASLYNATEPDQLRGPQHDAAWCDELAKWRYARETWDQLQFGLRVGDDPRQVITTTPRPIAILKEIIADDRAVVTRGSSHENRNNLPPMFFADIVRRYEGTRLGRQEIEAELLHDNPFALWRREAIEATRVTVAPRQFRRIVVAVDPPASSGAGADECGIIVAGRGADGDAYILADLTLARASPARWGAVVVAAYHDHAADRVIGEVNNGGEMVTHVIQSIDAAVPFKAVRASRGKVVRAEPVSAFYEQGRVHHVGTFPALEDQMCDFTSDFDRRVAGYSPDRVDALVWALSELMAASLAEPNIRRL